MTSLPQRFSAVLARIEACARRSNRDPDEIVLVAVTKTHPVETVQSALAIGINNFGENRVQEAETKIPLVKGSPTWHLIGHLQANKARRAVKLFAVIHSLDSVALARRLDRLCAEEGRAKLPVLIQVDLAKEQTKSGVGEDALVAVAIAAGQCQHLQLTGLMTLPPLFEDPERTRPYFRRLRELRDQLRTEGHFGDAQGHLSMGMTHDFEVAIEEGATMVRIGTAIFGARKQE